MYKIYINESLLILRDAKDVKNAQVTKAELLSPYSGKQKVLLNYIDMLEKTDRYDSITLYYHDLKKLWKDFKSLFKVIDAGGGIVEDQSGNVLMIHRRGYWDLPKGKIESHETKKQGAIREVMEETGITEPTLLSKIGKTYHVYRLKNNQRAIKRSHWYHMRVDHQKLIPQVEEDILKADWKNPQKFLDSGKEVYKNIELILRRFLEGGE